MAENWQKTLKNALNGIEFNSFKKHRDFSTEAGELFSPVMTASIDKLIDKNNTKDPLLLQFLPHNDELITHPTFVTDPVGDHEAETVPGLIHKYHGRVLLIASGSCAVNCRYCFRRHFPYERSFAPRNRWRDCLEYLRSKPEVHEVILSGGDPLTLTTKTLKLLTQQLTQIKHIKTLRIHSRIPVVMPTRITQNFIEWSKSFSLRKVMVLHVNHPNELGKQAIDAINKLKNAGYTLLNQSVLLQNINDSASTLTELSHKLFDLGILPYYLHMFDPVQNASHFAVDHQRAIAIYQSMQNRLPGYLLPKLVAELAGKPSKTIININHD